METEHRSETRMLAEQIKAITGDSLIKIHCQAREFVVMGLYQTELEALRYMFSLVKGE